MRGGEREPEPERRDDEETEELERQPDPVDPLKRGDGDEQLPGADPVVQPVPPE